MNRLGCSPRFATPGHPLACGLAERMVATVKVWSARWPLIIRKPGLCMGYVLWAPGVIPNKTTGVPT